MSYTQIPMVTDKLLDTIEDITVDTINKDKVHQQ